MNPTSVLSPPIAFMIFLAATVGLSLALSRLAFKRSSREAGATKPYACGEDMPDQMIRPNYGQFFPFAFFFTILHVSALMVAVAPMPTAATLVIALTYLVGAGLALVILYER